jgi:hypothetical protein
MTSRNHLPETPQPSTPENVDTTNFTRGQLEKLKEEIET